MGARAGERQCDALAASYTFGSNIRSPTVPSGMGDYARRQFQSAIGVLPGGLDPSTIHRQQRQQLLVSRSRRDHGLPEHPGGASVNNSIYGDILPRSSAPVLLAKVNQDFFGGKLNVTETMVYITACTPAITPAPAPSAARPYTAQRHGAGRRPAVRGQINSSWHPPMRLYHRAGLLGQSPVATAAQPDLENVIYNRIQHTWSFSDSWHSMSTGCWDRITYTNGINNGYTQLRLSGVERHSPVERQSHRHGYRRKECRLAQRR